MNWDESRLDWDACGIFLLCIKTFFSPFDELERFELGRWLITDLKRNNRVTLALPSAAM